MQVVLVMFRADGERRSFSVTRDVTVLGRREDCDLRIPLSDVSRKHCRFLRDGETVRIEDLGSSNGTYHNGVRVQEAELAPGDTIQVGPVVFCIQIDGVPAEEDMSPLLTSPASPEDTATAMAAENAAAASFEPQAEDEATGVLEEEPAAIEEEPLALEEEPAALEEEPLALEEEPAAEEQPAAEAEAEAPEGDLSALEDFSDETETTDGAAVAEEEPLALEDEPLELEEPPAPARPAAPPPLPIAPIAEVEEELDGSLTAEKPLAMEEEELVAEDHVEEDLIEDFEIIEDESEGSQGGDVTIDSEQQ